MNRKLNEMWLAGGGRRDDPDTRNIRCKDLRQEGSWCVKETAQTEPDVPATE